MGVVLVKMAQVLQSAVSSVYYHSSAKSLCHPVNDQAFGCRENLRIYLEDTQGQTNR